MENTEERFIEIETRIAYLEAALDDFNNIVLEQQKTIEAQNRQLLLMRKKLADLEENLPGDGSSMPADAPPPHY